MNHKLSDVQVEFRKARGNRDQVTNIFWIIEKAREFQKTSISLLLTTPKPLTVDHNKLWKILEGGNTRPPDLTPEKSVCRS